MALKFPIHMPAHHAGQNEPVKRPKEFACFSYDKDHKFHLDDSSLKWYYPPDIGADLENGYESFIKHDDRVDEHLDSLLKTITNHEQQTGEAIDAHIVTWRGMLTKIMATPFDNDAFEMNATLYRTNLLAGYKFETLSTIPRPWGEISREYIENRDQEIVNNKEQYCSVVRTGFGKSIVCLGGEVDAIWDAKPKTPGEPINWVELKTSAEIRSHNDQFSFDRKLMKYWIQSFLLGVPKIIVGFRTQDGILRNVEEFKTMSIPYDVQRRGKAKWDGNACIKFTSLFLEWLRLNITDEGVWRIKRQRGSTHIELSRVEEVGHGRIITDEFMDWRIKLSLGKEKPPASQTLAREPTTERQPTPERKPTPEPVAAPEPPSEPELASASG
ncbi:RAI1 like PD-XK nuclease-domain-containing protein [Chaetomidium leptoderma]|uniref:Decapping nuclease n=1 Tax=Chaetomidium leptoderma TaxID=669021 RepID=A0AAN6ZVP1_9PEZI|nr:RAI1 like PD-XK nuclease-domain-containing protein [Chaetomidium leptoderma]